MAKLFSSLFHSGTPQPYDMAPVGSGRYRKGSGENPLQRGNDFMTEYSRYKKDGYSDKQIANVMGMSTTALKERKEYERATRLAEENARLVRLREHGEGWTAISRKMGIDEGTLRSRYKKIQEQKDIPKKNTAEMLKESVDKYKYIDVGAGVELYMGVTANNKNAALRALTDSGEYTIHKLKVEQLGNPGKYTWQNVLTKSDVPWKDVNDHMGDIMPAMGHSTDGGRTFRMGMAFPESIDSSRVFIRYDEDGGTLKDGVIELRKGVMDISLGSSTYSQVRIGVDGSHYLKGMAIYSDNVPEGYDVIYNTNKKRGTDPYDVFKEMKVNKETGEIDKDNPFGATIKHLVGQSYYKDSKGKWGQDENGSYKLLSDMDISYDGPKYSLSKINKVNDEGDWSNWSRTLASQMLAKQSLELIKQQLDISRKEKQAQFDEIKNTENPVLRQKLLEEFADDCDSAAVDLKAAAMRGQASHVILPIESLRDDEVYAPNYANGTKVVLVRYPHGGVFESPELVVNNNNREAVSILGKNLTDAIGINHNVAEQLSGADFDGDSVLVIPNDRGQIHTEKPLFHNFDTHDYAFTNEQCMVKGRQCLRGAIKKRDSKDVIAMKERMAAGYSPTEKEIMKLGQKELTIKSQTKQKQMGIVSNLITDMTLKGANRDELERAVKHSMVVIDSEKHHLDYKRSEKEYRIDELKARYQGHYDEDGSYHEGSSTLMSRAKSPVRVNERKEWHAKDIDEQGNKVYKETGAGYFKNGKFIARQEESTKMAEAKDAFELSSGTMKEREYALYANAMKDMAREARLGGVAVKMPPVNSTAAKAYKAEVDHLNAQLETALKNSPLERLAQRRGNAVIREKINANPELKDKAHKADLKKYKAQALAGARDNVGASKQKVVISPAEWKAIQAGAVSSSKLKSILNNADMDQVRSVASPKASKEMSTSKVSLAKSLAAVGYTNAEIAERLGVSSSTVSKALK